MMHCLWGMEQVQLLSFSSQLIVGAVPAAAAAFVVAEAAETDAAAAFEGEFEAVETVVQLKGCAWHDYWDRIAAPLQKKQSSSQVLHQVAQLAQSIFSNAEFPLLMHRLMLQEQDSINFHNI